ncbi:MAG: glycosyltransferase [Candidatus Moraniibacteriota bacterium]|nr:MAG: glycosyltransferase [Candidatus Moranbacteria bacterium]
MRILLIHKRHFLAGGAERAYLEMADVLMRAGHEVAFFSMKHPKNHPTPWEKYFVDTVDYQDSSMNFLEKIRTVGKILWNRQAEKNMERIILDFKPDIAHVHNIFHQISPSIFRPLKKAHVPVVMTLHDYKLISPNYYLFVRGRIWDPKRGSLWKCVRDRCVKDSIWKSLVCAIEGLFHRSIRAYDSIQAFFSPSHFLVEKFREYQFSKEVQYLPNPLVPFPDDLSFLPLSDEAPFVFIGRLSPEKGVDTILRAVSLSRDIAKVRIVGDGPEMESLQRLARDLGVEPRVEFSGYLSGEVLEEARKNARAIIITSLWYENMPYALTEALGAGKVVIASRIGGISERIQDSKNGFLFHPGDEKELAEKMQLASRVDSAKIGGLARASISGLREEKFLEELLAVYRQLVP